METRSADSPFVMAARASCQGTETLQCKDDTGMSEIKMHICGICLKCSNLHTREVDKCTHQAAFS
jgi:hypothetical protein